MDSGSTTTSSERADQVSDRLLEAEMMANGLTYKRPDDIRVGDRVWYAVYVGGNYCGVVSTIFQKWRADPSPFDLDGRDVRRKPESASDEYRSRIQAALSLRTPWALLQTISRRRQSAQS